MIRALALSLLLSSGALAADLKPVKNAGPYVPSPQSVVADMLRYAEVGPGDFLIDLGSGDGRIVLTAAKVFGARGLGVEIKDDLVKQANEAAKAEGLADRAKFLKADLFKTDLSQASVVTMYLLPDTVVLLRDKFLTELKPGTRIVSHDYPLTGWLPEKAEQFELEEKVQISGVTTTVIYLYLVPAKVTGTWQANMPISKEPVTLSLRQEITRISGTARVNGKAVPVQESLIRGNRISFRLAGLKGEFTGEVKDGKINGMVDGKTPWSATLGG
ncbi:MAG TPA: methyltransferase domain-containing protein [Burkholderiales bacterium]|nr:methyltransferase domain-containing protein [Burkholderiales bacterium]